MKIAVTGSTGQLGAELCHQLGSVAIPLQYPDFDLTNTSCVVSVLQQHRPDVIINTAAYTDVDQAELEESICMNVNATSVHRLATVCAELDCWLVQMSTDYVFDSQENGMLPYRESDEPKALGVYARSKLAGERYAAEWSKHLIVRTCGLHSLGPNGHVPGRNFVDTILTLAQERSELSIVNDQVCTPTYVPHLARAIKYLVDKQSRGLYHVTNSGSTTWFEFAIEVFRVAGIEMKLTPVSTEEYGAAAPRPSYSVLDIMKYQQLGGPLMPTWQQGVADYLQLATTRLDG